MTKRTIKSGSLLITLFALCILQLFILRSETIALDNPHNVNNAVNCGNCHIPTPPAEWWTDQGNQASGICGQCHNPGGATDVKTHASPTYGGIVLQCTECHNPHYQRQNRVYKAESYLHTAVSDNPGGVTTTTITQTGAAWTVNEWAGMVLIPDVRYQAFTYRIASNTADTITINAGGGDAINTTYVKPGATFAIVYGRLIKEYMRGKTVKFFRDAGPNSLADGTPNVGGVDTVVDGICQVCHTQTISFNNSGDLEIGDHPTLAAGTDCATCHNHVDEFKPSGCDGCHGDPPIDASTLVFNPPAGTGSATAGAHNRHVATESIGCAACHFNSAGSGATHNNGDLNITLGFSSFSGAVQGGSYDGQTTANYNATTTTPATSVSKGGALTCGTIYCHSDVQADGGTGAPTYATPSWANTPAVVCGSCHKADGVQGTATTMDTGSHTPHLGAGASCNTCHSGNTHVDYSIDVTTGAYTAGGTPQNNYGTCSTASCHDDGTGTVVTSPTWGTAVTDCSECHATQPASGSHGAHLASGANCASCHNAAVEGTTAPAQHLDTNIDVYDTTAGDLGYPVDKAKGSAYTTCSAASCHDDGTGTVVTSPTWGTAITDCSECHATQPNTGAHSKHFNQTITTNTVGVPNCGKCHDGAVQGTTAPAQHLDTNIDVYDTTAGDLGYPVDKAKGSAYQSCTTAYCHSDGKANYISTNWGSTSTGCNFCHGNPPAAHPGTDCKVCHKHVNNTNDGFSDPSLHMNGSIEGGECITCHNTAVSSPVAQSLDASITQRRAIVPEFNTSAWNHKRTAGGAVTNNDCAVCHMEGVSASNPNTSALHKNGTIELRDPDTGNAITGFTGFTRNTASPSLETHVTNTQSLLCLKCHDAGGAAHASAQVPGGSALRPFNTAPTHTPGNNVLNVDAQFDTGNATFHPIKGPQNNPYCNVDTMVAPWNSKAAGSATPVNGPQISCWDCHTALNTAHGGSATLRAPFPAYASSPTSTAAVNYSTGTLCSLCHSDTVYTTGGGINGSAFGGTGTALGNPDKAQHGNDGRMDFTCTHCHGSSWADPGRPTRAADAHGFNDFTAGGSAGGGTTWLNAGSRPYAFLRNDKARGAGTDGQWKAWRPREDGATTNASWGCNWTNASGGGACNRGEHLTSFMSYGPGGVF